MSNPSQATQKVFNQIGAEAPQLAIVLGSGLAALSNNIKEPVSIPFEQLPGFPATTVSGHSGSLIAGYLNNTKVVLLAGRAHYYERGRATEMDSPIRTLSELGCEAIALSNAAGSTREQIPPGSLMAVRDHINWSGMNPLIGKQGDQRFVDMSEAYDKELTDRFCHIAQQRAIPLHEGVYAWFSGPSFETPAEIRAITSLGADAVGMSTVPETILARYYGLRVTAISTITNYAAGLKHEQLSHEHTKMVANQSADQFIDLFSRFAESFA